MGQSVDESQQRPLSRTTIARLLAYTKPHAHLRNTLLVLVVIRAVQLPAISWAIAAVIGGPVTRRDPEGVAWGVCGLLLLVLLTEGVFVYRIRLALRLGEAVVFDLRRQVFEHVLRMPMAFFTKMPLGRLLSRLTSDIDVVRIGIQDVLFVSTVQLGSMLVAAFLMLYYDWQLFLVVMTVAPALWYVIQRFSGRMKQAYRDVQESYSRLTTMLAESVNGVRVIQAFARQDLNQKRFADLMDLHARNNWNAAAMSATFVPILELNGQLFLTIVLALGGFRALGGELEVNVLVQFLFLSGLLLNPVPVLGRQYNQALTAMAGAERVFGLLDMKAEPSGGSPDDLEKFGGQVEFQNVHLEYEPGKPALTDVSFRAEAGQTVALVGSTGSGKSSIARLLARLYTPTAGTILLDGVDARRVSMERLRSWIRIVPQDNYLFSGSVLDNVRFAVPEATEVEVRDVARRLGILDLIEQLPASWATQVGEKGAALSQGQRQLVCFVRALLGEPRMLVLDEATSSVDPATEGRLQEALRRLLVGRTSFVVAHRLSTIIAADRILVVEGGRIVESGTHRDLLALEGRYAALYRSFSARR